MKPIHEVWVSTDSCNECWGWEDIEGLDPRVKIPVDHSRHRYIYTADQFRQAKIEVLLEAARREEVLRKIVINRMTDEIKREKP